jgi:hypothetical protein
MRWINTFCLEIYLVYSVIWISVTVFKMRLMNVWLLNVYWSACHVISHNKNVLLFISIDWLFMSTVYVRASCDEKRIVPRERGVLRVEAWMSDLFSRFAGIIVVDMSVQLLLRRKQAMLSRWNTAECFDNMSIA